MQSQENKVLIHNFWPPYWDGNSPELTSGDLGFSRAMRLDAGSEDSRRVFEMMIGHLNWDLSFFFYDNRTFYYLDMISKTVVRRFDDPNWDGKYEYDRCDIYEPPLAEEGEIVFKFTDPMEVWYGFTIDGNDMKYIVEHSVNWLSH